MLSFLDDEDVIFSGTSFQGKLHDLVTLKLLFVERDKELTIIYVITHNLVYFLIQRVSIKKFIVYFDLIDLLYVTVWTIIFIKVFLIILSTTMLPDWIDVLAFKFTSYSYDTVLSYLLLNSKSITFKSETSDIYILFLISFFFHQLFF